MPRPSADHRRSSIEPGDGRPGLFIHADSLRSGRQVTELQYRQPARRLSFSGSTGRLNGTPSSSAAGEYVEIRIQVSDGRSTATLGPFSITVMNANRAPNISGAPPTAAREGQSYEFTPTASDADGDTLTFSIRNRPHGLVSTARQADSPARLAPALSETMRTLRSMSAMVRSARRSPRSRSRYSRYRSAALRCHGRRRPCIGRLPADQSGRIPDSLWHFARQLSEHATDRQPRSHDAVIDNLPAGTYYFVATAYDSDGRESDFSAVVSKTIS